jgi:hypothetical protein
MELSLRSRMAATLLQTRIWAREPLNEDRKKGFEILDGPSALCLNYLPSSIKKDQNMLNKSLH